MLALVLRKLIIIIKHRAADVEGVLSSRHHFDATHMSAAQASIELAALLAKSITSQSSLHHNRHHTRSQQLLRAFQGYGAQAMAQFRI
jgi:hypothetical protein